MTYYCSWSSLYNRRQMFFYLKIINCLLYMMLTTAVWKKLSFQVFIENLKIIYATIDPFFNHENLRSRRDHENEISVICWAHKHKKACHKTFKLLQQRSCFWIALVELPYRPIHIFLIFEDEALFLVPKRVLTC